MGNVTKAINHLSKEEIISKIKKTDKFWQIQRWLVILNALVDPRPAHKIALHTGVAVQTVHNLISNYNRNGPSVMETPGRGGRRKAYLSLKEEKAFLESFIKKASAGQIPSVSEIKQSLEELIGHKVHKTTVYRLLNRNGWRKITSKPFHVERKKIEKEDSARRS